MDGLYLYTLQGSRNSRLDNPQKLGKLRVEALIFTGEMNKNYIGYSLQVEKVEG